jgi:hypothetical protein
MGLKFPVLLGKLLVSRNPQIPQFHRCLKLVAAYEAAVVVAVIRLGVEVSAEVVVGS